MRNGKKRRRGVRACAAPDVRITVSPFMFLMAAVFVAFGQAYEFSCSLTAVMLHELAHAKLAKRLGYALDEIRLMPYGAALCGSADIPPRHEIAIAAAGPVFNLLLALVFAAMWWLVPASYIFTETFCVCNIYIGLFNLLPVYPLDGGRVTLALLSARMGRAKAYRLMRILSFVAGVISVGLFVLSAVYAPNVCFLTVGCFMVVSALVPDDRARYYALFALGAREKRLKKPFEVRTYAVAPTATVAELCRVLDPDRLIKFEVYGADMKRVAVISEAELIAAAGKMGYDITVERLFA